LSGGAVVFNQQNAHANLLSSPLGAGALATHMVKKV
jgi:hypothetical protein